MLTVEGATAVANVFLEEAAREAKSRVLSPLEGWLENSFGSIFALQAKLFGQSMLRVSSKSIASLPANADAAVVAAVQATADVTMQAVTTGNYQASAVGAWIAAKDLGLSGFDGDVPNVHQVASSFATSHVLAEEWADAYAGDRLANIADTTRTQIRQTIVSGIKKGYGYETLAKAINAKYAGFSEPRPQAHIRSRAHMVAVTELHSAYEQGAKMAVEGLKSVGLVMEKKWLVIGGNVCPLCSANSSDEWIDDENLFSSGASNAPAHPGCRCTIMYQRKKPDRGICSTGSPVTTSGSQ